PVATNAAIAAKTRLSCISGGMVVFPSPEHHSDKGYRSQGFRNSPGSLAISLASAITHPPGRGHKRQLSRLAPRERAAEAWTEAYRNHLKCGPDLRSVCRSLTVIHL